MTVIEGITPGKKHATVSERRGSYVHHHEVKKRASQQQQTIFIVALSALIIVVVFWIGVIVNGSYLKASGQTDKAFFEKITNSLEESDKSAFPNKLSNYSTDTSQKETTDEINKELFPDLTP